MSQKKVMNYLEIRLRTFYICIRFIIVMNTTLKRKEDDETIRTIVRA